MPDPSIWVGTYGVPVLNTREIATVVWIAVLLVGIAVLAARKPDVRRSLGDVLRAFFKPKLVLLFVLFFGYLSLVVWLASAVGAWESALLSETVLWFVVSGAAMWMSANDASKDGFFSASLRRLFAWPLILECYYEIATFPLWVELAIQPVVGLLLCIEVVAGGKEEYRAVRRPVAYLLVLVGLAMLVGTAVVVAKGWHHIDWAQQARLAGMFVWLPLAALPAVYLMSWGMAYGVLLSLVRFRLKDAPVRWSTRLAIAVGFNIHLSDLGRARPIAHDLAKASNFFNSLAAVRRFRGRGSAEG